MAGGGYGNYFTQYQSLPTNLQNYVGGQGSPSLMNQHQQGQPQQYGWGGPRMGNPFMLRSPYSFMSHMGHNFGAPTDYNAAAVSAAGPPVGGAGQPIGPSFLPGLRIPRWTPPPPRLPQFVVGSPSEHGGGGGNHGTGPGSGGGHAGGNPHK